MTERTEEVVTDHGSVEYETAKCCSCGERFKQDDMYGLLITEDFSEEHDYTFFRTYRVDRSSESSKGYVCSFCRKKGILGYPQTSLRDALARSRVGMSIVTVSVAFCIGYFSALVVITVF
jgi:hypothetical protein